VGYLIGRILTILQREKFPEFYGGIHLIAPIDSTEFSVIEFLFVDPYSLSPPIGCNLFRGGGNSFNFIV